jgi:hypothetical protein
LRTTLREAQKIILLSIVRLSSNVPRAVPFVGLDSDRGVAHVNEIGLTFEANVVGALLSSNVKIHPRTIVSVATDISDCFVITVRMGLRDALNLTWHIH